VLGVRTFQAVVVAASALTLAILLWTSPAPALEYSELEQRMVDRALGPAPDRDEAPGGKRIESVQIVRLPVFDDDDPVPDFVNWFHSQSREHVIRRELLFVAGDAYDSERIEETLRNLQLIAQFGVVVIVPVRSPHEGQVRLIVIVRDVWSLRLNFGLQGSPTYINYLIVSPIEENLLGTRTRLGAVFTLQPDRYTLGAVAGHPRIAGSKLDASALAGAYVNLDSGETEGSYGLISLRRDLVSLADKWGFLAGVSWTNEETRLLQGKSGVNINYEWTPSADIVRQPVFSHGVPIEYSTRLLRAGAEVARSFGTREKYVLTSGIELSRRNFAARRGPESAQDFAKFVRDEVPVSDTRVSPFVQLEHRTTRFLNTRDVETLELQESFSLGQQAALRVYPAFSDIGSSRNLLGTASWLSYTWPLGNGFLRTVAASSLEHADMGRHQANAQAALRIVSPRLRFLRLVLDYAAVSTYRNYLNRKVSLGGEARPRGYINSAFRGASGYAGSLELRTSSINVLSARVGAVAFYDVGGVGDSVATAYPNQSLGAGVRILFPQINRQVFRIDWAAPLTPGPQRQPDRALPGSIYFTFGQAFDVPKLKLPEILGVPTTLIELSQ
jgi:hypothetical protein